MHVPACETVSIGEPTVRRLANIDRTAPSMMPRHEPMHPRDSHNSEHAPTSRAHSLFYVQALFKQTHYMPSLCVMPSPGERASQHNNHQFERHLDYFS